MLNETTKTSLLIVAGAFSTTGTALIAGGDVWSGAAFLLLGAVTLVVRGVLKARGYETGPTETPSGASGPEN